MRQGAIILCGGKSTRMGSAKALLPFGPELMLQRVVRLIGEVVAAENIVVVAAANQSLPTLPAEVHIARDSRAECGPLEGLAAGMAVLVEQEVEAAYVTSCDVPLLVPAFVERMFGLLADHEIVVPRDNKFHHPLAAVYRVSSLAHIKKLLAADRLRLSFLFEELDTREVPVTELRTVDPELATLENLNRPEDYTRALRIAGFS